jgi:hypothetical protein
MEIIRHFIFKSPLKPLNTGSVGSKYLHHRFIVLDLQNKSDPAQTCGVLFEKNTSGIIFQSAEKHEEVKKFQRGILRQNVEMIKSTAKDSFCGNLFQNIITIGALLDKWDIDLLNYSLSHSTFLTLASGLTDLFLSLTGSVQLNIPGKAIKIPIYSDKILPQIERMFPKWTNEEVTLMPEIQKGFAIMTSQHEVLQQQVVNTLLEILKGRPYKRGR